MKEFILFLFIGTLFLECTKEKSLDPVPPVIPVDTVTHIIEFGKATVKRNGPLWKAAFSARYYSNQKARFYLEAELNENNYDHRFVISDISAIPGYQTIEGKKWGNGNNSIPNADYFVTLHLDALINSFQVDSTRSNQFIEILRYDSVQHIVEGRFQTFLEGPNNLWFLQDTVSLTEGKFHLKIQ
ncbi:MAG: hypothetical protein JNN28_05520 [Saprospiraceae bacterium]|nr:hypothetical protein [Saprospiraceae bacterium]